MLLQRWKSHACACLLGGLSGSSAWALENLGSFGAGDPWSPQNQARLADRPASGNGCMPQATLCSRLPGMPPAGDGITLGWVKIAGGLSLEAERLEGSALAFRPSLQLDKRTRLLLHPRQRMLALRWQFD